MIGLEHFLTDTRLLYVETMKQHSNGIKILTRSNNYCQTALIICKIHVSFIQVLLVTTQDVEIEGVKIYGAPWHNERHFLYRANSFGTDSDSIKKKWQQIPNDVVRMHHELW